MTEPVFLKDRNPLPAEPGKWVYGIALAPHVDGRIPVAAPGGLATLGPDGKLLTAQRPSQAAGMFVPTRLAIGDTFTVPAATQALFALPIDVGDGAQLIVDGDLIAVPIL